jgi:ADP-ribosyltransferase exoenzyme
MAGGLGDAWRPELHPRDRFGRFRSKWKLSGSAERLVDEILSSFNPVQFKSEDEASNWLSQRVTGAHAKGTMPGKPPAEVAAYLQHSVDANAAVRAGHDSPEVSGLDQWWEPSDEAMILTRVVGPEAFGLNASNSDAVEEWTSKLVQDHAPGSTNLGTPIQAGPGDITMYIAAPKGTKMIVPGNGREILTSPDTTYRITHVQRNANGGHDALAVAIPGNSKGQGRVKQLGTKLRPTPLTEEEKADIGPQAPARELPNAPSGTPLQQSAPSAPEGSAPAAPLAAPVKKARAPRKPKEPNPLDQPPPGEGPSKLTGKTEESAALHAWMQSRQGYPINPTPKDVQITRDGLDMQKVSDIRDAAKNLDLDLPPLKGTTKEDLVDSITHQLIGRRAGTPPKRGPERLAPETSGPSANAMHAARRREEAAAEKARAAEVGPIGAPPAGQAPSEAEIRAKAVAAHQQAVEAMKGDRPVKLLDVVKKMSDAGVSDGDINAELQRMLDSGEMRRGSADGTVIHHPLNAQAEERAQILSDLKAARKAAAPEAPGTPEVPEKPVRAARKTATKAAPARAVPAKAVPAPVSVPEEKAPEAPSTPPAPSTPEPVKASLAQDATALRVKQNLGDNPDETKLMKGALDHEEAANHFRTLARNSENRAGAPESKKAAIAHYKAMAQLHQDEAKSLRERAAKARAAEEKASAAEEKASQAVEKVAEAPKAVEKASEKATPELSMPEHTRPSTRFADNALKDAKKNLNKDPDGVVDKLRSDAEQLRSEPVEDPRDLVDNLSDVDSETMREVSHQDAEKLDEIADQLEKAVGDSRENAGKANALERKAAIRRETRNRSAENPVQLSDDSKAALERAKAASDRRLEERRKEEEAKDEAARAKFEPWLKAAGVKESDLSELQKTGLMIVAGNTKLSKPEMIRRLRTKKGDTLLDKIADAAEMPAGMKRSTKGAPEGRAALKQISARMADAPKGFDENGLSELDTSAETTFDDAPNWSPAKKAKVDRALRLYRNTTFKKINNFLRGDEKDNTIDIRETRGAERVKEDILADHVQPIDDAMKASRTKGPVTLWRGVGRDSTSLRQLGADFNPDSGNAVGREFTDPTFVSTSADPEVGRMFGGGALMRLHVPGGVGAIQLTNWKTEERHNDEAEVLLQRGLKFRVTGDHMEQMGVSRRWVRDADGNEKQVETPHMERVLDVDVIPQQVSAPAKKAAPSAPSRPSGENGVMLAARTRQAHIDKTRPLAELAAALNERHHETVGDPDHPRIMRNDQRIGLKDLEKELPDLAGEKLKGVDQLRAAGPDELAAKAEEIAKRNGITLHGSNGDVEPFDPKRHNVLGKRPEVGSPVQVLRPGTSMDYNGEHVSLDKAVVHSLNADEVKKAADEGHKVDPKLLPKAAAPTTKTATPSPSVPSGKRSDQLDEIAKSADVDLKALGPKGLEGLKEDLDNPKMTRADVVRGLRRHADSLENSTVIRYGGHIGRNESDDFKRENLANLAKGKQNVAEIRKLADAVAKAKLTPHGGQATESAAPRGLEQHIAALDAMTTRKEAMDYLANVKGAELNGLAKHYNVSSTMESTVAGRRRAIADATGGGVETHVNVSGHARNMGSGVVGGDERDIARRDTEAAQRAEKAAVGKLILPEHAELSTRRADNSVKDAQRMLERGDSPAQVAQHLRDAAETQRNDPVQDSRDLIHNTVDRDPAELRAMNRGDVTALNTLAKKVEKLRPIEPAAKKAAPAPARPEIPLADTADYERRVAAARAAGTINDRQVRRALAGDREAQARVIKTATPSKPKVATSTTPKVHDVAPAEAKTTGLTGELVNHVRNAKDDTEARQLLAKTQLTTLRAMGRENGVPPFTSKMKKADMIYAIVSHVRGGGSAPAVPATPSREDRVAAHLLRRAEESQPGSAARILNDMPAEHRQLVKDAVDRVTGTKTPAATAQVKKAPSTPDVVPDVSTTDVRGAKPVSEMNKDELLDEAYNRGIANPTQYTIAQLRGLLGLPGGGGASSGNGLKMSDKPLIPNTWGTGGGPVHFHESGAIGRALRFMGDEKRLDVSGEPLANVLGRIATDGVTGRKTTQQVLDSLKEVNAKLPEGSKARKELTNTIEDLDAPPRHIRLPETAPAPLQKLMDTFSTIPLARRTHNRTTGKAESRNEMDELKQVADEFAAGEISGFRLIKKVSQIQNRRHESQEGRMEIDRAVREAVKELEAMGLSTPKPST